MSLKYGCYQSVPPPAMTYTQLAPSPLTPTPPQTPDCGLLSPISPDPDLDLARRSLHLSPLAGVSAFPVDYGVENMLMDPRWTTMGQYLGDTQDMIELERRAHLQLGTYDSNSLTLFKHSLFLKIQLGF